MTTGKRVLVTGAAGFLGSHLCEQLLERGHEVLCVTTLYQAHATTSKAKEILGWEPKTQLREGLIKTIAYFEKLPEGTTPALASSRSL